MKFSSTAIVWMLFNASASSFATQRNNFKSSSLKKQQGFALTKNNLPFVVHNKNRGGGGGTVEPRLSATVDASSSASAAASVVSQENLNLLSERGQAAISKLIENDIDGYQSHVYGDWPEPGTQDDDKRRLAEQVGLLSLAFAFHFARHCFPQA